MNTQSMEAKHELLVQGFIEKGYYVSTDFFDAHFIEKLRADLKLLIPEFHRAGIGSWQDHIVEGTIRRDEVLWIDQETSDATGEFLRRMEELKDYLNYTCYAGINGSEFHYARYPKGAFYKKHVDSFKSNNDRLFTVVLYLNETNWQPSDGGHLKMYLPEGEQLIEPQGGKIVFFKSDEIEHEVLPANRERLSVTGWFRKSEVGIISNGI